MTGDWSDFRELDSTRVIRLPLTGDVNAGFDRDREVGDIAVHDVDRTVPNEKRISKPRSRSIADIQVIGASRNISKLEVIDFRIAVRHETVAVAESGVATNQEIAVAVHGC